jgi:hypothetical protein
MGNESQGIQVDPRNIHYTKRNYPPAHINNVQLPQEEDVKYLGLHLDRRLTWHKHIFAKRKQLEITLTKIYWLLGHKSILSASNKLPYINQYTNLALRNTTLGYGFHFQHRNPRTFPIESLAHESGRALVRAEYGYPKGSSNTNN